MKIDSAIVCHFNFFCREQWDKLATVSNDQRIRHCSTCNSHVYLTETYEELEKNIEKRRCVAIRIHRDNGPDLEMVGDIAYFDSESHANLLRDIETLNLPPHVINDLKVHDLHKIGDLVACTEDRLLDLLSNDWSLLNEIKESLALFGLRIEIHN